MSLLLRTLKARMAMKELSLRDVSRRSRVEYCRCSEVLGGHRIHPPSLSRIIAAIDAAPMPDAHPDKLNTEGDGI